MRPRPEEPLTPEQQAAAEEAARQRAAQRAERRAEQQRREAERRAQAQARREEAKRRQLAQQESGQLRRQARKRPAFGSTWWSKRWTAVLETFGWAARVARGAEYARQGAVRDLVMDDWGVVTAAVQGSRPESYRVELSMLHLTDEVWNRVLAEMSNNALLAAKLLAGEMPEDIEEAFFAAEVTLFPYDGQEILADCTCPDQINPCKHIAAVFYTLAQEFDRDPFLIFRFRGRSADQIASALRALRAESGMVEEEEPIGPSDEVLPLEQCLDRFWLPGESLGAFRVAITPPATPGAVLLRLGQPNGWDGARGFIFTMAPYYQALSEKAMQAAFAEETAANSHAPPPINALAGS
ncbi:MAG: SWIM zinc finger family protein [Cyanobacteria bacterium REEB65]|nr:SWIM zinc finger family protein [Cyanobacteria bacterium REEB65]